MEEIAQKITNFSTLLTNKAGVKDAEKMTAFDPIFILNSMLEQLGPHQEAVRKRDYALADEVVRKFGGKFEQMTAEEQDKLFRYLDYFLECGRLVQATGIF